MTVVGMPRLTVCACQRFANAAYIKDATTRRAGNSAGPGRPRPATRRNATQVGAKRRCQLENRRAKGFVGSNPTPSVYRALRAYVRFEPTRFPTEIALVGSRRGAEALAEVTWVNRRDQRAKRANPTPSVDFRFSFESTRASSPRGLVGSSRAAPIAGQVMPSEVPLAIGCAQGPSKRRWRGPSPR